MGRIQAIVTASIVTAFGAALSVPAGAATNVTATANEVRTFLGGRTGKLVYADKNASGKCFWIDLSDMSVTKLSDDTNCSEPLISPDGTRVVYGLYNIVNKWPGSSSNNEGDAYIRPLGSGSRTHVGGAAVASKQAFAPHWWVNPSNGDEYVVYMDYYEKDQQSASGRGTWKQKLSGNSPTGAPIKILNHAFDGGLSKDGKRIGEAYHYCHMAKTSDLGGGDGNAITARLDGGNQCCNASMSPDNNYRLMHLRIDHTGADIEAWDGSNVKTISKPSGATEMQNPEFSTDPGYSTFTAQFGTDYYIYIANTSTGDHLEIARGNFSNPHLWVGSATASTIGLSPTSLSFSASQGGSSPSPKTVGVSNLGAGTLENVSTSESASWLTVSRSGSGNSQTLTNTIDISGLAAGTYTETVQVSAAGASNSPQSYSVSLAITEAPRLATLSLQASAGHIEPGQSTTVTAYAKDQNGNPFAAMIDWAVSGGGSVSPTASGSAVESHATTFTSNGTEGTFTVTASSGTVEGSAIIDVSTAPPLDLKVNCGDNAHDVGGWQRDDAYVTGGGDWVNPDGVAATGIPGAAPADIYKSVRHASGGYPTFTIPEVGNGTYVIRLHFADAYDSGRQINLDVEGARVLSAYDIATAAGGTNRAVVEVFNIVVSDGNGLTIALGAGDDGDAFVAGFEVMAQGDGTAPTVEIQSPAHLASVSGTLTVAGVASDDVDLASVAVCIDDGPYEATDGTDSWTFVVDTDTLGTGTHTLRVRAQDAFGNRSFDTIDLVVDENPTGPSIKLLSPAGGEVWSPGSAQTIRWSTVNLDDITLRYTTDGGVSWNLIETSVDVTSPNWGAYPWTVPDTISSDCRIYASGYFGEAPTESGTFEIASGTSPGSGSSSSDTVDVEPLVAGTSLGCAAAGDRTGVPLLLALLGIFLLRRRSH